MSRDRLPAKQYLGDGAYAEFDKHTGDLVLTTDNGIDVTNRIVLESTVLVVLLDYLAHADLITWKRKP
jgi:hypothetical protein